MNKSCWKIISCNRSTFRSILYKAIEYLGFIIKEDKISMRRHLARWINIEIGSWITLRLKSYTDTYFSDKNGSNSMDQLLWYFFFLNPFRHQNSMKNHIKGCKWGKYRFNLFLFHSCRISEAILDNLNLLLSQKARPLDTILTEIV